MFSRVGRLLPVRPTSRGWQVIFFGALALAAARLVGTTQFYQFAYAFFGLLLVALVLGLVPFRSLRYTRRVPVGERLIAGENSPIELVLYNASRNSSPSFEVLDHLPERRLFKRAPLKGHQQQVVTEPVVFKRRGLYQLGPAQIHSVDPFGLLRFIRRFEAPKEVVVYPKTLELNDFPLPGHNQSAKRSSQGSFGQQEEEFSSLREYRHGDDWRHIHWKSVARTGELVVKEFDPDEDTSHAYTIVLDLKRSPGEHILEAEVEDAVSAAASIFKRLAKEGLALRLLCTDEERQASALGEGEACYWQAMEILARAQPNGNIEISDFLNQKLLEEGRHRLGDGVILITRSLLGEDLIQSVKKLKQAGLSVLVVALATHTYHGKETPLKGESAFLKDLRRLQEAGGAEVRIIRKPGGALGAFAKEGSQEAAAGAAARGAV